MQDKILYIQISIVYDVLCNETSVVDHSKLCHLALKHRTLGAVTTASCREFHGFTTRMAKLNFMAYNHDCCACSFNE